MTYKNHKDHLRSCREYSEKHQDRLKILNKKYREENKERINEYIRLWREANNTKQQQKRRKSKFYKLQESVRRKTRYHFGNPKECFFCKSGEELQWHHFSYDKEDSYKECVGNCRLCHAIWHMSEKAKQEEILKKIDKWWKECKRFDDSINTNTIIDEERFEELKKQIKGVK